MKALNSLVKLQAEKKEINQEQNERLERIKRESTRGKSGFEWAVSRLRRLMLEP